MKLLSVILLVSLGLVADTNGRKVLLRSRRALSQESSEFMSRESSFMKQESKTVSSISSKVSSRFEYQDAQWSQQSSETQQLQQSIQSHSSSSSSAQHYAQQFESEKREIQRAQAVNDHVQDQIQGKIHQVQGEIASLEQNHQNVVAQKSSMNEADYNKYQDGFVGKQTNLNTELKGLMEVGKKAEQANNYAQEKVDQWQNGWAANPVVGEVVGAQGPAAPAGNFAGPAAGGGGGGGGGNKWGTGMSGNINLLDAKEWEEKHDQAWGNFENFMGKWQNWTNDPNAGNYRLANLGYGAFDNGEFNVEKQSEEFFGPDHVRNDWKLGNYTTNAGFGVVGKYTTAGPADGDGAAGNRQEAAPAAALSPQTASVHKGDGFWNSLKEQWRREVGAFFDEMIARFKKHITKAVKVGGLKFHGPDIVIDK